jgi:hypothetical protein
MDASRPMPPQRAGFFRTLWRVTRQLFHETAGAMFFVLALSWTAAAVRNYRQGEPSWLAVTCGGFAVMMAAFGVLSFRSARRVR